MNAVLPAAVAGQPIAAASKPAPAPPVAATSPAPAHPAAAASAPVPPPPTPANHPSPAVTAPPAPHVVTQAVSHQAPAVAPHIAHIFDAALAIVPGVVKSSTPPAHVEAKGNVGPGPFTTIPKWTARIRLDHHEVTSSFSVLLFLGEVPEDPKQWRKAPSYVGADDVFVNTARENCENCSRPVSEVEGFVHLNGAIMKHPEVRSLEPEKVKPYLKDNLHWRVKKVRFSQNYMFKRNIFTDIFQLTSRPAGR